MLFIQYNITCNDNNQQKINIIDLALSEKDYCNPQESNNDKLCVMTASQ